MSAINGAALIGFLLGICIGLTVALHIVERRARRYKEAARSITVTPDVLRQINSAIVTQWLDANGYVWMPKGPEFKVPKEIRR